MTPPTISTGRQREMVRTLRRVSAELCDRQEQLVERRLAQQSAIQSEFEQRQQRTESQFDAELSKLRSEYAQAREAAIFQYESEGFQIYQNEEAYLDGERRRLHSALADAKTRLQAKRRTISDAFKTAEPVPRQEFVLFKKEIEAHAAQLSGLAQQAQQILHRRGLQAEPLTPPCDIGPSDAQSGGETDKTRALEQFKRSMADAQQKLHQLHNQRAARWNEEGWPVLLGMFAVALLAYPCYFYLHERIGIWWFAAAVAGAVLTALVIRQGLKPFARRQTSAAYPAFREAYLSAVRDLAATLKAGRLESEHQYKLLVQNRDRDLQNANDHCSQLQTKLQEEYQRRIHFAKEENQRRRVEIYRVQNDQLRRLDETRPPLIEEKEQSCLSARMKLAEDRAKALHDVEVEFRQGNDEVLRNWREAIEQFDAAMKQIEDHCRDCCPPYLETDWETWSRPLQAPQAISFGKYAFTVQSPNGMADDDPSSVAAGGPKGVAAGGPKGVAAGGPRGMDQRTAPQAKTVTYELPSLISFADRPSLLLLAEGEGRQTAISCLQNVMLRMMTALPQGKVRFTIIDPVGLGQSFSAFMHLADFDEKLVTSRIWTEPNHINQRLIDLTEHMENVIQKYLRNEYASIQQYNEHAGEVAEPYHVLVAANFPAGFSEEAATRLLSIANSGARCGVCTLVSVDVKMKMPRNFELADLQAHAETLQWIGGKFKPRRVVAGGPRGQELPDPFEGLPLMLESPPDDACFTKIVQTVGRQAKDAGRVEVPFEKVAPPETRWWSGDSRTEIETPIGRAGAAKLQYLRLGKGVSQHVLVAGKTGSGKSTLLHALITSLSVHYSPEEIQFYLIDFKKGVEFKPYATLQLPHARVIAIESEREFGMSVLERLDAELRQRGDRFRQQGVQDIAAFRDKNPHHPTPRILLIIDEFQEFFVSDDKIAQEAALLLDRLVRQGRAFGIHVLLGSQTLSGAYTLARSTLGQMAVRIALQCSESDAHLILSEDNTAARLLSRPGEAIYNDANGMFEGNHPFQVVWLPDHQREQYLSRISDVFQDWAAQRAIQHEPAIVFEGNAAADPAENDQLRKQLETAEETSQKRFGPPKHALAQSVFRPKAFLGAPVSIKEPTSVVFHRQSGCNLLLVGPQEEAALALLTNCLISLAAQCALPYDQRPNDPREDHFQDDELAPRQVGALPLDAQFHVLDGVRSDSPEAGFWRRLAKRFPAPVCVCGLKEVSSSLEVLAQEVDRRINAGEETAVPRFLFIHHLSRFRDLQKTDDFGFSSFSDDVAAGGPRGQSSQDTAKQFGQILKEGPAVGVHTLIWCDTFNNCNRWLDRQTLREFSLRVLFQMSATDSSNLMDSPAASRLGMHRALVYNDEEGTMEKFRPYRLPSQQWLNWVFEQLNTRIQRQSVS